MISLRLLIASGAGVLALAAPAQATYTFVAAYGSSGAGAQQFDFRLSQPNGLSVDGAGHLWVADGDNNRVQQLSAEGAFLSSFGGCPGNDFTSAGCISGLSSAVVDPSGALRTVQLDATGPSTMGQIPRLVKRFTPAGAFVSHFGSLGTGPGELDNPSSVDVDPDGNLYVVDRNHDRVLKYDSGGNVLATAGTGMAGSTANQFDDPADVAVAGERVYVTDVANHRIQVLNRSMAFVGSFTTDTPNLPNGISDIVGLDATDSAVAVADRNNAPSGLSGSVAIFGTGLAGTSLGRLTERVSDCCAGLGMSPRDTLIHPTGRLYVVNDFAPRTSIVRFDPEPSTSGPRPPYEGGKLTILGKAQRGIIEIRIKCPDACGATATLRVSSSLAKRLGRSSEVVGTATARRSDAGVLVVKAPIRAAIRKHLRKEKIEQAKVGVRLTLNGTDGTTKPIARTGKTTYRE